MGQPEKFRFQNNGLVAVSPALPQPSLAIWVPNLVLAAHAFTGIWVVIVFSIATRHSLVLVLVGNDAPEKQAPNDAPGDISAVVIVAVVMVSLVVIVSICLGCNRRQSDDTSSDSDSNLIHFILLKREKPH